MNSGSQQPPKKVFDIMRPGKTPAGPTSRPVIVGHKPEVHDEMIGGNASRFGSKEKRPLLSALAKVTIQPPKQSEAPTPAAPVKAEVPMPQPEIPKPSPATTSSATTSSGNLALNSSVNLPSEREPADPRPLSDKLLADAAKEPDNPNPMMQHGEQAYVSHHKGSFTFGQALLTILAIVILTAIAINFLLDADVIKTDIGVPHTNFL